jgi:integrase
MATIEKREGSRGTTYRVRVRLNGELQRTRTFKRKTDAELWAKKVESDLGHGFYVPTTADRRRTLGELIDKFIAEQLPIRQRKADERNVKRNLAWWKEHAGFVTLDKLTPQTIAGFRSQLLARTVGAGKNTKPVTQATVNRYLAALSAVCKWAWKELHWLPANPVLGVGKGPESTGVIRFLSDDERKTLMDACKASIDPNIYCAVALALATGARYSNLRMLTWEDVDFESWRLRFQHTKNGEPRYVPVVGPAQRILQQQFERDPTGKDWIFKGGRNGAPADLDAPWRAVRRTAGLTGDKHCRFHDLRHTTVSYLTMNGATLAEVAEALGHRTLMMAKRYSHQSGEHVRGTLERMASRFLNELSDEQPRSQASATAPSSSTAKSKITSPPRAAG